MNRGDRGITLPAMDMKTFRELVNLPPAQSPFDPDHLLIDSGSDISLVWNENMFTCMEPCTLKQCTPVGSTPLSVQAIGVIRFNLGSYVDSHGQRHTLDLEIPSVYYVPESAMNLLSTTDLKRYNIHLNSQCGPNVLIVPGLTSQVSGVWGNWYQGYGRDGYPAIYLNLGEGKSALRNKPVDNGKVWTTVSAAVEQVQIRSERHNVNIAALHGNSQRQEVTPEFLAHLAFNHCGDNVMKLMRKHPDLFDLNLGPVSRVVGHAKHCMGCLVANGRLGARAAYNHCLTKVATSPSECYFADVAGPISPLGIGGAKYILVAVDTYTRFLHAMPLRRKSQAASLLAQLFESVRVQVIRKHNNGVRKLHTDKGGEFMSRDLESFCAWRGIVHTFSDTAAHQSNGVAERRTGQLTTGIRSCLLRSCLPHHLWVEAAMHVAHAQILLPSQTFLNRESGTTSKERQCTDLDQLSRLAPDIRRCIPYLLYYGDVTDDTFRLLVQQMRPFGVQVIVFYGSWGWSQHGSSLYH